MMEKERIEEIKKKMFEAFDLVEDTIEAMIESGIVCTYQRVDPTMEINSSNKQISLDSDIPVVMEFDIPRYVYTPLGSIRFVRSIYRVVKIEQVKKELIQRAKLIELPEEYGKQVSGLDLHQVLSRKENPTITYLDNKDFIPEEEVENLFQEILREYLQEKQKTE